jgi:hypothetical protein
LQEILFGYLDMNQMAGILAAFELVMSRVYLPALKVYDKWGEMEESPQGRKAKKNFIDNFSNFLAYLRSKHLDTYIVLFIPIYVL